MICSMTFPPRQERRWLVTAPIAWGRPLYSACKARRTIQDMGYLSADSAAIGGSGYRRAKTNQSLEGGPAFRLHRSAPTTISSLQTPTIRVLFGHASAPAEAALLGRAETREVAR